MGDENFLTGSELEEQIKKRNKRKKLITRFTVIFFVILILLTFFSNTIMNYSLPEVSTVTVYSGSVSQKVRCQGSVEVSKDLEVTVSGKRVVKEVFFEDGDTVKAGDVIMTFEETENTDLTEAEKTLESLETSYEKSQLRAGTDYTDDEVSIANAQEDVTDAENALTQARTDEANLATAKAERDTLQYQYDVKNIEVTGLQTQVDAYEGIENYEGEVNIDELIAQLAAAKEELTSIETSLTEKKDLVTELEGKTSVADAEEALESKQQTLASLQRALASKKNTDALTAQENALTDKAALEEIEEQKAKIEKLKAADDFKEIKAAGSGVITGITVKEGDTITADTPVANISLTESGYEVSCTVTKQQAQLLRVGNEAAIENIWDDNATSTIKSIKADPSNPNQQSIVKFSVKGDVQVGETLQFAVGEKAGKYDTVVPNNAVKDDIDGKYVYVVKVKATPLGNRYIIKKQKVEVIASDTTNSAIQGEVSEYDNVVTNASKPLDNGQQVRLSENQ